MAMAQEVDQVTRAFVLGRGHQLAGAPHHSNTHNFNRGVGRGDDANGCAKRNALSERDPTAFGLLAGERFWHSCKKGGRGKNYFIFAIFFAEPIFA